MEQMFYSIYAFRNGKCATFGHPPASRTSDTWDGTFCREGSYLSTHGYDCPVDSQVALMGWPSIFRKRKEKIQAETADIDLCAVAPYGQLRKHCHGAGEHAGSRSR